MNRLIHSAAFKPHPLGRGKVTPLSVSILSPSTSLRMVRRVMSLSNHRPQSLDCGVEGLITYEVGMIEIILNKDIDRVGKAGVIIKVKDGFARNFLIPNGLAMPMTAANLKKLEAEKEKKRQQFETIKKQAEEASGRLIGLSVTIPVLAQDDKLYGSLTTLDIAAALKEEGFDIDRNNIILPEPIKSLGIYEVTLNLHPEVSAKVKIWVVKK